jgi:glycosyltransferase involved in cell wall biosynthesis
VRICFVTDIGWPAGGAEKSIKLLRTALEDRGHHVIVVATDKGAAERSDVFADVLIPHIQGPPLTRLGRFFFYPAAYRSVRQVCREFRPDLVHFHTIGELSPSCLAAVRGIPFVITVHGPEDFTLALNPWHLPASDYRRGTYRRSDLRLVGRLRLAYLRVIQRPAYQVGLRRTRAMIAPSRFLAEVLSEEFPPSLVQHIYNGIDMPAASSPLQHGRHFLYVGRLEAVKGVDVLIQAVACARRQEPSLKLTVVGDGRERLALEALTDSLALSNVVEFRGWLPAESVWSVIQECDILVIPSVWPENLPTVALEAIGAGRPIIASRIGGIPELVEDGSTGFVVDPYDVEALAERLCRLASDPSLCRRMGLAARRRAAIYTTDRFVAEVLSLYAAECGAEVAV